jgi:hypothetical protein
MTEADMNRKIAEWMGWDTSIDNGPAKGAVGCPPHSTAIMRIEKYASDLNLCAQMQDKLKERGLLGRWVHELGKIVYNDEHWESRDLCNDDKAKLVCATALDRCKAAIKVIEKP